MSGKMPDNERKACDAVVRCLEEISACQRANAHSPEDEKVGPPVEYVVDLGAHQYAVEHTVVEAFPGQIQTNIDFGSFVTPVTDVLDYNLPKPGLFTIWFSIHPTKGMKPKRIAQLQAQVVQWVTAAANELHAEYPIPEIKRRNIRGHRNRRKITIDEVEVELEREAGWFIPATAEGRLLPGRKAPTDYETLRRERLNQAMAKKLPKLKQWRDTGARSVLILENGDLALSNHTNILEAAEEALVGRGDHPDEIWLVDVAVWDPLESTCRHASLSIL